MKRRRLQKEIGIFLLGISILDYAHAAEGQIEFGIGHSDSDFLFSPYPGIDQSPFVVLNADIEEAGEEAAWRITARDLGIDTRTFRAEY